MCSIGSLSSRARCTGSHASRGHRFTVADVVRLVAARWDVERIREDFPFIDAEDVRQALLYAADYVESTTLPPEAA